MSRVSRLRDTDFRGGEGENKKNMGATDTPMFFQDLEVNYGPNAFAFMHEIA